MKSNVLDKSIEIIFRELKGIISENDYLEYSAKNCENEKVTQTVFRVYSAEKSARLVLEQYTINSRAYGVVFNIYPTPESGIPIFTFQLGGQIPDKVIFVLDIIPVIVSGADAGISGIYKKHSLNATSLGSGQDWINKICSANALICQYKPLDPEYVLLSLADYLCFWRDTYYLPSHEKISAETESEAIKNILKFKSLLHANDAGLDIYTKKFGKKMADVIIGAAFGSEPSLDEPIEAKSGESALPDKTISQDSGITWTGEAEQYLQEAPKFVRSKIRRDAEKKAQELGLKEITSDLISKLRK